LDDDPSGSDNDDRNSSYQDDNGHDYNTTTASLEELFEEDLPPHLQRELHKEERRKLSIRWMAMKKPMYDNIEMYNPEGELLCTIAEKKAKWYVRKQLAKWLEDEDNCWNGGKQKIENAQAVEEKQSRPPPTKIQLLFAPKGKSVQESKEYNTSHKKNICVVCGDNQEHMRHYVIPYCYRTLLPEKYKTHMPHDIVILCPVCHLSCEQATQRRQKWMEGTVRRGHDKSTAEPFVWNRDLYTIKSRALALLRHSVKPTLPSSKVIEYQTMMRQHCTLSKEDALTEEILRPLTELEVQTPNPKYIPGANLVVETLTSDEAIEDFIRDWREHFLEASAPRFLPHGWDVDSPVHSDIREEG
jgi:exonuclease 3'-5' domain-containing protein 2